MKEYEIIIIGAGPAGLQAGIHSARRRHSVLILGKPEASALFQLILKIILVLRKR